MVVAVPFYFLWRNKDHVNCLADPDQVHVNVTDEFALMKIALNVPGLEETQFMPVCSISRSVSSADAFGSAMVGTSSTRLTGRALV